MCDLGMVRNKMQRYQKHIFHQESPHNVLIVPLILDETIIVHFKSLEKAVECSKMNDSMVIYAGSYSVGALVFQNSISVTGNSDVTGNHCMWIMKTF